MPITKEQELNCSSKEEYKKPIKKSIKKSLKQVGSFNDRRPSVSSATGTIDFAYGKSTTKKTCFDVTTGTIATPACIQSKKSLIGNRFKIVEPSREISADDKTPKIVKELIGPIFSSNSSKNLIAEDLTRSKNESSSMIIEPKKLQLEVMDVSIIPPGTLITITSKGYLGSKRGIYDGCVYFGNKTHYVFL